MRSCILLLALATAVHAQDTLKVVQYGVEQGLPQSSVWSIIEDDFGFLWVSTADGVCRFDGYTFHKQLHDDNDPNTISFSKQQTLGKDANGNIWIAHQQGIDIYNAHTGIYTHPLRLPALTHYTKKIIGEDGQGRMWTWPAKMDLYRFDRDGSGATHFPLPGDLANLADGIITGGFIRGSTVWAAVRTKGIFSLDINTSVYTYHPFEHEVDAIQSYGDSIIIAAAARGIVEYNTITKQRRFVEFDNSNDRKVCNAILQVNDREFWFGTERGIYVYDATLKRVTHHYILSYGPNRNYSNVYALYKDRSGNIWVGTNGDGLKKIPQNIRAIKHYSASAARGEIVKTIYADEQDVWVGYYDNGIDIFDHDGHPRRRMTRDDGSGLRSNWVYAMAPLSNNRLFVSCIGDVQDYAIIDRRTFRATSLMLHYSTQIRPVFTASNDQPAVLSLHPDTVLFNDAMHLVKASLPVGKMPLFEPVHSFPQIITTMYRDNNGSFWVGTLSDVYLKKPGSDPWMRIPEIGEHHIKTFCQDAKGKIWVGTTDGIFIVDSTPKVLRHLTQNDGILNEVVYGILRDDNGSMWFSHNQGLTRWDTTGIFRHFSSEDGLQSNEFNTGAFFKSNSGELFFGGIYGTNSFYPAGMRENTVIPIAVITAMEIFDKPFKTDSLAWAKHDIVVDYTQNSMSFSFASLEFTAQQKNSYRYRMIGLDEAWVNAGTMRTTRYANLAPGRYRFEVIGSNNDGLWSTTPAFVNITIIPPFWATSWFRVVAGLLALGSVAGITYVYSRSRYRRKMREMEMEQKMQYERERISRELHDNIGAQLTHLSSSLEWISNPVTTLKKEEKDQRIEEVARTSRDVMRDLRETIWALKKKEIGILDFSDKLKTSLRTLQILYPEIHIAHHDSLDGKVLGPEEALNLLRICQEAVSNALRHSGCHTIDVRIHSSGDNYRICIEDDGKGFSPASRNDHYGLENMTARAREIGAKLDIRSSPGGTVVEIVK